MANLPPIKVNPENTPGQHIDYLVGYLSQLGEGDVRGLAEPLVKSWITNTQRSGMVPLLARALGNAALVLFHDGQPPLGRHVDDLVRRLKEVQAEAEAKRHDPSRKATAAQRAWEKSLRRERLRPDVLKALREAGLMAHQHFKKTS